MAAGASARTQTTQSARPAHVWWNFTVFGSDMAFFSLGLSISSVYTVLPLFVHHLTPDNVAIALIPAVRALGQFTPQLLVARQVERLRRALPFILFWTVFERIPYLGLAAAALFISSGQTTLLLALFYAMLFLALFGGGMCYPAWLDLIARAIPAGRLGRFFGFWGGLGGVMSIGGAALGAALLSALVWPLNFAACFALTFAAMVISFTLLALGREPLREHAAPAVASASASAYRLARRAERATLWEPLLRDGGLRKLLIVNAVGGVATMASGLFAVAAVRTGGLSDRQVGVESVVLFVAATVGNVLWGMIGDHFGHRTILVWGAICAGAAGFLAFAAHGFLAYSLVFMLVGLNLSATTLAGLTFIAQFGPEARRPTYAALASVAYAPFAIGAPLLGGWLADVSGYTPVFLISGAAGLLATLAYQFWVPDPRTRAQPS